MNAFFFANNDQMTDAMFAQCDCKCCRDLVEPYAASDLLEVEGFFDALNDDIKAVCGNEVDSLEQIEALFAAAAKVVHPYGGARRLLMMQSQIEVSVLDWVMAHGIKSKPFANRAIAYNLYLHQECAA